MSDAFEFHRFGRVPRFALANSLFTRLRGWLPRYLGDWGHPRGQVMMRYEAR
ncbi:MAG: hypothetical protein ACRELC_10965 [Gemmatimonadota bacterium]